MITLGGALQVTDPHYGELNFLASQPRRTVPKKSQENPNSLMFPTR